LELSIPQRTHFPIDTSHLGQINQLKWVISIQLGFTQILWNLSQLNNKNKRDFKDFRGVPDDEMQGDDILVDEKNYLQENKLPQTLIKADNE